MFTLISSKLLRLGKEERVPPDKGHDTSRSQRTCHGEDENSGVNSLKRTVPVELRLCRHI